MVDDAARERVRRVIEGLQSQFGAGIAADLDQLRAMLLDILPEDRAAIVEATTPGAVSPPAASNSHGSGSSARSDVNRADVQPTRGPVAARVAGPAPPVGLPVGGPPVGLAVGPPPPPDTRTPAGGGPPADVTASRTDGPGSRRRTWVLAGVAAAVVLVLVVVVFVSIAGDNPKVSETSESADTARVDVDAVLGNPDGVNLDALSETFAMGARDAGVEITALSPVDSIGTVGDGDLRVPPKGGKLIAFRLASATCDFPPCKPWRTLNLHVSVDGDLRPLPAETDSFVVAVPAGTSTVDLVTKANGYPQKLSLLDGSPGADNIAVLVRENVSIKINQRFRAKETSSVALEGGGGPKSNVFYRNVFVDNAYLWFFKSGKRPSSAREAFLEVQHSWSGYGLKKRAYSPKLLSFFGADGIRYRPRELTPRDKYVNLYFEVPADTTKGWFVMGGSHRVEASDGTRYTETVEKKRIRINFGAN